MSVTSAARKGLFGCFFFSSRRRHTRSIGDWSSDVCSSDLGTWSAATRPVEPYVRDKREDQTADDDEEAEPRIERRRLAGRQVAPRDRHQREDNAQHHDRQQRSEERRVGKEWRSRG